MSEAGAVQIPLHNIGKFRDVEFTADGARRATVQPAGLRTLWFNTGTLCNLTCENCYIESSPSNDRLAYLELSDVTRFLDEARNSAPALHEIGFTGGEPFMNPAFPEMVQTCCERGYQVLILTNAMRPMMKCADALQRIASTFPQQLTVRVSIDHYTQALHEEERGRRAWKPAIEGLKWLNTLPVRLQIAGRTRWGDDEAALRQGFAALIRSLALHVDAEDPAALVLFPEMDPAAEVPEITTECWGILHVRPEDMMCATSRMVVRHRDADAATVVACTLLPYAKDFAMGATLAEALRPVALNHPHCARFCVLGGGSCSA